MLFFYFLAVTLLQFYLALFLPVSQRFWDQTVFPTPHSYTLVRLSLLLLGTALTCIALPSPHSSALFGTSPLSTALPLPLASSLLLSHVLVSSLLLAPPLLPLSCTALPSPHSSALFSTYPLSSFLLLCYVQHSCALLSAHPSLLCPLLPPAMSCSAMSCSALFCTALYFPALPSSPLFRRCNPRNMYNNAMKVKK